jgi:hypothetical protein
MNSQSVACYKAFFQNHQDAPGIWPALYLASSLAEETSIIRTSESSKRLASREKPTLLAFLQSGS